MKDESDVRKLINAFISDDKETEDAMEKKATENKFYLSMVSNPDKFGETLNDKENNGEEE